MTDPHLDVTDARLIIDSITARVLICETRIALVLVALEALAAASSRAVDTDRALTLIQQARGEILASPSQAWTPTHEGPSSSPPGGSHEAGDLPP